MFWIDIDGRDGVVGIATRYGVDSWCSPPVMSRISVPVYTGPEAYPAYCKMDIGSLSYGKVTGEWL